MKRLPEVVLAARGIKERRQDLGLTLAEVAERGGFGASSLWYAESERAGFTVSLLFAAVAAMNGRVIIEWDEVK
jgi:transcriptional regulator with XRE-family HTH domain